MKLRKVPYWYLWAVPALAIFLGAASNQFVLIANHGKFPVMMNEAQVVHFCAATPEQDEFSTKRPRFSVLKTSVDFTSCSHGGQFIDQVHSVMGPNSRLKAMSDILNLKDGIYSIGDIGIILGSWLFSFTPIAWTVLTVRKLASLIE